MDLFVLLINLLPLKATKRKLKMPQPLQPRHICQTGAWEDVGQTYMAGGQAPLCTPVEWFMSPVKETEIVCLWAGAACKRPCSQEAALCHLAIRH